jgi:hypothetical protein
VCRLGSLTSSHTGDGMSDDPQVRRMRTTIWVDDESVRDALFTWRLACGTSSGVRSRRSRM